MIIENMQYTFHGHILGFGDDIRKERLNRLRSFMRKKGLETVLFVGRGVDGICQWLTALPAPDIPEHKDGGYLVHLEGPILELTGDAVLNADWYKNYKQLDLMPMPFLPVSNLENRPGLSADDIILGPTKELGVVRLMHLKKNQRDYLCTSIPGICFLDVTQEFRRMVSAKSEEETEAMRIAANSHDRLFSKLRCEIRPERMERDIVVDIRNASYCMGGAGQDCGRMVLVDLTSAPDGEKAAEEPLRYPGRRLQMGDRVNVALRSIGYYDYYAGLGRCFVLGKADEKTKYYWEIAVEAQQKAASVLRPGGHITEAAEETNRYLKSKDVPEDKGAFIYGVGYTVGETPVLLEKTGSGLLEKGMTLIVAPVIRVEGMDPFCCMDTYLITESGCERLTQTSQKLIELCGE